MFCYPLIWSFGVEANQEADIMASFIAHSPCSFYTCIGAIWFLLESSLRPGTWDQICLRSEMVKKEIWESKGQNWVHPAAPLTQNLCPKFSNLAITLFL